MNVEVLTSAPHSGQRALCHLLETQTLPDGSVTPRFSFSLHKAGKIFEDNQFGIMCGYDDDKGVFSQTEMAHALAESIKPGNNTLNH